MSTVVSPTRTLFPEHLKLLEDSGIDTRCIQERGYYTEVSRPELARIGFGNSQRLAPGLVIPLWDIDGRVASHQLRPDRPRILGKRTVKYETPTGARPVIDVPPLAREKVLDAKVPLYITEGARKADAAISKELCCVSLPGVWGWKKQDDFWVRVPLEGREVSIAFDSDLKTNEHVSKAAAALYHFLKERGADVRLLALPAGPDGRKVGLDDHLAAGNDPVELARLVADAPRKPSLDRPEYEYTDSGLFRVVFKDGEPIRERLTNFGARIVAEVTVTDGKQEAKEFRVEAKLPNGTKVVTVKAEEFERMLWVYKYLGAGAILPAGFIDKDRVRAAIQTASHGIEYVTAYTHTGFIEADGDHYFIHAGGIIGADHHARMAKAQDDRPVDKPNADKDLADGGPMGPISGGKRSLPRIEARLPPALGEYVLPSPLPASELLSPIRKCLKLLKLGPGTVSFPLFAGAFCAPLGDSHFTIFIDGRTGNNKSVRAALIQQFFGQGMDFENPPGSWSATANSNESNAFLLKDVVYLIDDYVLTGTRADQDRANAAADRVIRAQANGRGRGRSNREGVSVGDFPPRGLLIITGEAMPKGHSLNARTLRLEARTRLVEPGSVERHILDSCQRDAARGVYAQVMAGYIRWLAADYEGFRRRFKGRYEELRGQVQKDCKHARTATIVGKLLAAFELFLEFAEGLGAISRARFDQLWDRQSEALLEVLDDQNELLTSDDPVEQFRDLLATAFLGGEAHLENVKGGPPADSPRAWGWREEVVKSEQPLAKEAGPDAEPGEEIETSAHDARVTELFAEEEWRAVQQEKAWRALGPRIGWIFDGFVYLLPEAALKAAQGVANRLGHHLPLTIRTLGRELKARGWLKVTDEDRGKHTKRVNVGGKRVPVLVLESRSIIDDDTTFDNLDADAMAGLLDPSWTKDRAWIPPDAP